jgi:hypothetical protein
MKKVIATLALVAASGTSMAASFSKGNVDLDGWAITNQPTVSGSAVAESSGIISRDNVDLFGWAVENHPAQQVNGNASERSDRYTISKGNVDLFGWAVADVMAN